MKGWKKKKNGRREGERERKIERRKKAMENGRKQKGKGSEG